MKLAVVGQKFNYLSIHKFLQTEELVTAAIAVINSLFSFGSTKGVLFAYIPMTKRRNMILIN